MKIKRLLSLALAAMATTSVSADFKEAIQMSQKAHKQIEFVETKSGQGNMFTGTYKVKENGLFDAISLGNKSAALELGPYWKKSNLHTMVTGKVTLPYQSTPSLTAGARMTYLNKRFVADAGGFYNARDGHDTYALRATPGVIAGPLTVGVEYSATNGKKPTINAIGRYDGKSWHVVLICGNNSATIKIRKDFK